MLSCAFSRINELSWVNRAPRRLPELRSRTLVPSLETEAAQRIRNLDATCLGGPGPPTRGLGKTKVRGGWGQFYELAPSFSQKAVYCLFVRVFFGGMTGKPMSA